MSLFFLLNCFISFGLLCILLCINWFQTSLRPNCSFHTLHVLTCLWLVSQSSQYSDTNSPPLRFRPLMTPSAPWMGWSLSSGPSAWSFPSLCRKERSQVRTGLFLSQQLLFKMFHTSSAWFIIYYLFIIEICFKIFLCMFGWETTLLCFFCQQISYQWLRFCRL